MPNFFLSVSFVISVQVHIFPLNMRDIIIYVARWREKYLSKRSLIKHTCSWRYKLIVLRILNRQEKKILRISLCYVGLNFSLCVNITSQYNVYSVVWRKKHGQNILKVVRKYEKRQLQLLKVQADIKVIKTCKSERLILIFVNVKLSIKQKAQTEIKTSSFNYGNGVTLKTWPEEEDQERIS